MKRRAIINLITGVFSLCFIVCALPVYGESSLTLVPDKKKVAMGLRFGGDTIAFHGTIPQPGTSLIVWVESENNPPLKLSRKGKMVFFWMSVKQFEISEVPFLYKIICSGKLNETLNENQKKELHIGYEALKESIKLELIKGKSSNDDNQVVFDGFLKMKEQFGLYEIVEDAIAINDDLSFTFALHFSDRAVEGNYEIECFALKDGALLGKSKDSIAIEKVGLAKWLTTMAQHHGALYGIIAVIVAIFVGLLAGFIFKGKGGH